MNIELIYQNYKTCNAVNTDTRKLQKGDMYFALKGDNFDGNAFVKQAFEAGAKYCVVDDENAVINKQCLLVNDSLTALQQLATHHRKAIGIPIIALTGSNGKTTTKELIYSVLATTYKVSATKGNLNNHIGVPLTLLSFSEDLDFGIVEMGANHLKEIEFLSEIAQPDYGLITNFGKAHLEGFGSIEGVIKGKSELYNYLKSNSKTIFINTDNPKQIEQVGNYFKTVTFGSKQNNDCSIMYKKANPYATLTYNSTTITSQLIGAYNNDNIAVAVTIGKYFKVSDEVIKTGIENYKPENNRSEIIQKGNTKIILDAYNANPTSMTAALENLKQLDAASTFLFLGDMFELGESAKEEHQAITNMAESYFENNIFLIGENFYQSEVNNSTLKFNSFEDLADKLKALDLSDATVLVKGSRGMKLERIIEII